MAQLLRLGELTLEIGFQLIPLVDEKQGGQLLNRVRALRRLTDSVRLLIGSASAAALPVLLCPSPARYHVKRWLEPVPRVAVVAASEIPPEIRLRPVGTVR
jgi:flagellar biosynthesis protein FlhA